MITNLDRIRIKPNMKEPRTIEEIVMTFGRDEERAVEQAFEEYISDRPWIPLIEAVINGQELEWRTKSGEWLKIEFYQLNKCDLKDTDRIRIKPNQD